MPQQEVRGIVSDQSGMPLPGVTVIVKGKNRGTTTDIDGEYSIGIEPEDILIFSFIGFKTREEPVNGRREIHIQLEEDVNALQEVIINAGYYNTTERERTGNISRITSDEIERQPVTNPLAAMQGRMPGVHITQTTGVPGGGFDIQIRGRNSLRTEGNEPLYIIDGIPFSSQTLGSTNISGSILPGLGSSPLNNLNPNDIASIEVLKDADATAIYGSRGANGVILITTKKGKIGETKLDLNIYSGIGEVTGKVDLLNTEEYLQMRREAFSNDGITEIPAYAYDVNGVWDQTRDTDWQEELIGGTANISNIHASFSGGDLNTQFVLNGSYYNETTVFPGDFNYGKATVYTNLNHSSKDNKFGINLSATYVADKNNLLSTDLSREALRLPPNAPELFDDQGNLNWAESTWENPLRNLESKYSAINNNLIANAVISYKIGYGLEIKSNLGFNNYILEENTTFPSSMYNPAYGLGSEFSANIVNSGNRNSWIIEPQLTFEKEIGKGKFDILGGVTFQEQTQERLELLGEGFTSNQLIENLAAASNVFILDQEKVVYNYTAVFGRINYNLNKKYILNLTGRRDGSSRFGEGKKFANFGAIGAAWLFSEEKFIQKHLPFISFGKLRGSLGITGSDRIGDYQFLDTYTSSGNSYNGNIGLRPNRLSNPFFSWEKSEKAEIALELGFYDDRLLLKSNFFKHVSSNQLVGIPLPGTTGFSSIQANLDATVENKGVEIEFSSVNFRNKNFSWTTSFNLSVLKNELVSFPGLEASTYANQFVIGEPLSIRKVYSFTGVDPETGIYQFNDFNNDGMISPQEDRQEVQHLDPKYYGGFSNSLTYKGLNLDFLFQFVNQMGTNTNFSGSLPGTATNQPKSILNRWQQPGDMVPVQRYTAGFNRDAARANFLLSGSNAAYSDASFIRLKNLSLSYKLPEIWNKKFQSRVYLQGQNLFNITGYEGADPETEASGFLPPLRIVTVGAQITF